MDGNQGGEQEAEVREDLREEGESNTCTYDVSISLGYWTPPLCCLVQGDHGGLRPGLS